MLKFQDVHPNWITANLRANGTIVDLLNSDTGEIVLQYVDSNVALWVSHERGKTQMLIEILSDLLRAASPIAYQAALRTYQEEIK